MKTRGTRGLCAAAVLGVCTAGSVRAQSACAIAPKVRGSIRYFPQQGHFEILSNALFSNYFNTDSWNREFRRAFLEFKLPSYGLNVASAILQVNENRGTVSAPVPAYTEEVAVYDDTAGVDFAVTVEDFDRPLNSTIATFQTDGNLPTQQIALDVTYAANHASGPGFGLRIKLANDPVETAYTGYGTGFDSTQDSFPFLELTLPAGALPCEPVVQVQETPSGTRIGWSTTQGALDYDVAYGSVHTLKTSHSFISNECAADNLAAGPFDFSLVPPVGDAYWFLVRDNDAGSCRSYGGNLVQQVLRDGQINACACQ